MDEQKDTQNLLEDVKPINEKKNNNNILLLLVSFAFVISLCYIFLVFLPNEKDKIEAVKEKEKKDIATLLAAAEEKDKNDMTILADNVNRRNEMATLLTSSNKERDEMAALLAAYKQAANASGTLSATIIPLSPADAIKMDNIKNRLSMTPPIKGTITNGIPFDFNCDYDIDDHITRISGSANSNIKGVKFNCNSGKESKLYGADLDPYYNFTIPLSGTPDQRIDFYSGSMVSRMDKYGGFGGNYSSFICDGKEIIRGVTGSYGISDIHSIGLKCA